MKATLLSLVFVASAFAQDFMINTPPNVAQCQPLQLTWTTGKAPYFLTVNPGSQPNGPPLINLGQVDGNSFSWSKVNVQANTQIGFSLRDSNGAVAQTATVTVNDSGDTSCLGQMPSGSGGSASPAPTGSSSGSSSGSSTAGATTPASSSGGSTSSSSSTPAGASTSRSASASATSTNAASANVVQVGAAGIIGAALAALLA